MEDKTSKMSQLEPNWSPEVELFELGGTMLLDPGVFNFRKDLVGDPTQETPAGAPDPRLRQQPATALGDLPDIDLFINFGRPRPSKINKNNKSFNLL